MQNKHLCLKMSSRHAYLMLLTDDIPHYKKCRTCDGDESLFMIGNVAVRHLIPVNLKL